MKYYKIVLIFVAGLILEISLMFGVAKCSYRAGVSKYFCDHDSHYPLIAEEKLRVEQEYSTALLEGLHWYMMRDTRLWNKTFKKTKEYNKIDSLIDGRWDDFYTEWK